jgi:chromate reductase
MGASLGAIGTARAQYHLRQIFVALNLFPLNQPEVIIADAAHRFDEDGNLIHEPTKQLIQELLKNLVDWTRRISSAPAKLTLLEAQLMEGEIQRPETLNSPVTETSARNGA